MKILFLAFAASFMIGCNNAGPVAVNSTVQNSQSKNEKQQTVISHSSENQAPPKLASDANSGQKTKWSQSGSPIDTK